MQNRLASEFARVIGCQLCTTREFAMLLRDGMENLPQPGYVGPCYGESRLLLVGQNPGKRFPRLAQQDRQYMKALRSVRDQPSAVTYDDLMQILRVFIRDWPIHGSYFPLAECGLELEQIAYCNIVRCRTDHNKQPGVKITRTCMTVHFERWLNLLRPRVVVFIGKWAFDQGARVVESRRTPTAFIDRQRSLSLAERKANRAKVVSLVREAMGYPPNLT